MSQPTPQISYSLHHGLTYAEGLALQQSYLKKMKKDDSQPQHIFFVEHKPVITLGRSGDGSNLKVSENKLSEKGIEFHRVGRGGDITYHGPGQWTVYPLLRLEDFCRDLHRYMRMLEEVVISYLSGYGIDSGRRDGKTGVWIGHDKICAIGVSVSRWISWHGFALNINTNLSAFSELMTPCGISPEDGGVTSLNLITGKKQNLREEAEKIMRAVCMVMPLSNPQLIKEEDVQDCNA